MTVRSGFLGRAGFVGLGSNSLSFGLGLPDPAPFPPYVPPPLVLKANAPGPQVRGNISNTVPVFVRPPRKVTYRDD